MQNLVHEDTAALENHIFSEVTDSFAGTCNHLAPNENQAYGVLHPGRKGYERVITQKRQM